MKKFLGITTVIVAVVLLTGGTILLYRLIQFRSAIESIQAAGDPVSFQDLQRTNQDSDQQSLLLLNRLKTPLTSFEKEMWTDEDVLDRPVDDEMIARFNELNAAYPDVFPLIEKISNSKSLQLELRDPLTDMDSFINELSYFRSCARVLCWKSRIQAAQGASVEAVDTALQNLRICRLLNGQPTLVAQLVVQACRSIGIDSLHDVIQNHAVPEASRELLNRELENQDALGGYYQSLIGERVIGIETLNQMGIFQLSYAGNGYLKLIGSEIESSQNEWFQKTPIKPPSRLETAWNGWVGSSMYPAIAAVRESVARSTSNIRALRIINSLQPSSFDAQNLPTAKDLAELGIPEKMTIDTMTGDPMKIRFTNGWLVYSVGPNGEDDGGKLNSREDFALGPSTAELDQPQ